MGLFGNKKGKTDDAAAEAQETKAGKKAKKEKPAKAPKKKSSGMGQILHESVVETAIDKFRENDAFIHKDRGVDKYVGIVLDTMDIGGLDKKSRKDEAKGSIIECINSGRIATYISQDLLDAECICIIPDPATLTAMDEFTLLTEAPYEFCLVDSSGEIELLGIKTTFNQVSDLVVEDGHIDNILGTGDAGSGKSRGSSDDDDDDDFFDDAPSGSGPKAPSGMSMPDDDDDGIPEDDLGDDEVPDSGSPDDDDVDDVPSADDIPDADDDIPDDDVPAAPESAGSAPIGEVSDLGDDDGFDLGAFGESDGSFEGEDPYAAAMQADQTPEQEIPEDFTNQTVIRKFYSEDLGLEVTSEPFDAQFMQNNPYIPFEENREPGWINDQLNEMSRAANVELARMHNENLWQMRERYFKLVSYACDRIRDDLDIHDKETQYGQMFANLGEDKADSMSGIERRVVKRKAELNESWKKRLQEVGVDAARAAQRQYIERYGRQHEMELYGVEATEKAAIEDDYQDQLHAMYEQRRIEAASLLDLSITEVLEEISDMYLTSLTEERERFRELSDEMKAFVDAHRQEDVARSNTLAEELRQTERADKVLAEQTAKIQSLSEEYRQKREGLLEEIETMKRENAAKIAAMKESHEQDMANAADEKAAMQERYDKLLDKFKTLDADKEKEFQARFEEMRDLNDALEDRCDHLMEVHRRSNLVSTFLIIAIAIATLAIGFIGGAYVNTQQRTALEQQTIMSQAYQQGSSQSQGGQ